MCFILASESIQEVLRGRVGANAELSSLVFLDFLMTIGLSFALKLEKIEVILTDKKDFNTPLSVRRLHEPDHAKKLHTRSTFNRRASSGSFSLCQKEVAVHKNQVESNWMPG
jgi:hypothetical protein